jgi:hypothetical protein
VLYGCCFINTPRLVASYNLEHAQEVRGTGPRLDTQYLKSLGPQAIPVLEPHVKAIPVLGPVVSDLRFPYGCARAPRSRNWRDWSFRAWRLEQYLANNPADPPAQCGRG